MHDCKLHEVFCLVCAGDKKAHALCAPLVLKRGPNDWIYEIYIFPENQKLGFGTIENGLAASGFPPEGPKKGSYVEKSTFIKIKK